MTNACLDRPESQCSGCSILGKLKCRFKWRHLAFFYLLFAAFFIPAMIGVFRAGYQWYLLGWAFVGVVFFGFWEIRILCSHCPYYAEPGPFLRCIGNYGLPKVWKYNPNPISTSEKIQLVIGLILVFGYPFPFTILGGQYLWTLATAGGTVVFFAGLLVFICPRCVNFSCLFNRVPDEVAREYLNLNPVMKKHFK
jgi:hypothetical protein